MSVQDFLDRELFVEDTECVSGEMESLLKFIKINAVPLTSEQVKCIFLLREFGMSDISDYVNGMRSNLASKKDYLSLVNSITLGDRIKGNAKLANIVKAQVTSATGQIPNLELQRMKNK